MAVVKLTSSKKAVSFIDEEGNHFIVSAVLMDKLLSGKAIGDFLLLTRLPLKISKHRFKPSPLFDPDGLEEKQKARELRKEQVTSNNDGISNGTREKLEKKKAYDDTKKVW